MQQIIEIWRSLSRIKRLIVVVAISSIILAIVLVLNLGLKRDAVICNTTDANICGMFAYLKETKGYEVNATLAIKSDFTTYIAQITDDGNRMHVEYGPGSTFNETIIIGKAVYVKESDSDTWIHQELPESDIKKYKDELGFLPDMPASNDSKLPTYTKMSTTKCSSKDCYQYQINNPARLQTTQYAWIDVSDHRLRFMRVNTAVGENSYRYSFDKNITIEAPAQTQSPAAGKTLVPGAGVPDLETQQ